MRSSRRWTLLVAGFAGLLLITAGVTVVAGWLAGEPVAMRVDDWELSRQQLERELEAVAGNDLYLRTRQEMDVPLRPRTDGGGWDPAFVAEVLDDRLRFHLAALALEQRGGEVSALDLESARSVLADRLISGARLPQGEDATLEVVLDQFGAARAPLEDGVATVEALRRVLRTELGRDAGGEAVADEAVDDAVREALVAQAAAVTIEVAPDLGRFNAQTARIEPVAAAVAGLEPVDPEDRGSGGTVPAGASQDGGEPPPVGPPPAGGPSVAERDGEVEGGPADPSPGEPGGAQP